MSKKTPDKLLLSNKNLMEEIRNLVFETVMGLNRCPIRRKKIKEELSKLDSYEEKKALFEKIRESERKIKRG